MPIISFQFPLGISPTLFNPRTGIIIPSRFQFPLGISPTGHDLQALYKLPEFPIPIGYFSNRFFYNPISIFFHQFPIPIGYFSNADIVFKKVTPEGVSNSHWVFLQHIVFTKRDSSGKIVSNSHWVFLQLKIPGLQPCGFGFQFPLGISPTYYL